jgi:hypothetical protein
MASSPNKRETIYRKKGEDMRQNDVPTIGQRPNISKKDEERMTWQALSKLWDGYADIVSKIKGDEYLDESNRARKNAAYYIKRLIDSVESDHNENED